MKNWKSRVYKKSKGMSIRKRSKWDKIKDRVFQRDGYVCQMCKKLKKDMSCHHIKPRKNGGKDHMYNLITLCEKCHNIAEVEEMTRREIIQYDGGVKIIHEKPTLNKGCKDWRKWVYGGQRRV